MTFRPLGFRAKLKLVRIISAYLRKSWKKLHPGHDRWFPIILAGHSQVNFLRDPPKPALLLSACTYPGSPACLNMSRIHGMRWAKCHLPISSTSREPPGRKIWAILSNAFVVCSWTWRCNLSCMAGHIHSHPTMSFTSFAILIHSTPCPPSSREGIAQLRKM